MKNGMENAVWQMKQKEEDGLNYIYSQTYNFVYLRAKSILKNEEDVADAMAETVLTCWEKISTLRKNRCILHQSGNHGYCVAEYYRSEFQPSGVFGKRILGRNERTARL